MHYEYWHQGLLVIVMFAVLMAVPCLGVALIGYRLINKLGRYPSKTPEIQMSICLKLFVIEFISFGMIYVFFKFFVFLSGE